MRRVHCYVSGRVQGVFFRANTREKAHELGLTGSVRNLRDGRVEVHAQGRHEDVEALVKWLHDGSPQARVEDVEVHDEALVENETGFEIERG